MDEKGYIHVYTGNGKGKTTAAFGLAVRALCAGKEVFIGQFVKSMKYHETNIEAMFPDLKIRQFGRGCFINKNPEQVDIDMAREGLRICSEALESGDYDMVVLDELTIAIYYSLLAVPEVIEVLESRNPRVEVVITGRYAPDELVNMADLVTDMTEVKHYYAAGVEARDGIER